MSKINLSPLWRPWKRQEQPNSSPAYFENNDCFVIALSQALNIPYFDAWMLAGKHGRLAGKGTPTIVCLKVMAEVKANRLTLPQAFRTETMIPALCASGGSYIVIIPKHAFAVCGGLVLDNCEPRNARIDAVFQIR